MREHGTDTGTRHNNRTDQEGIIYALIYFNTVLRDSTSGKYKRRVPDEEPTTNYERGTTV